MEGHQKFLGEGGLKNQNFETKYKAKLEFFGGKGMQNKNLPLGEGVWIFLELHNFGT